MESDNEEREHRLRHPEMLSAKSSAMTKKILTTAIPERKSHLVLNGCVEEDGLANLNLEVVRSVR